MACNRVLLLSLAAAVTAASLSGCGSDEGSSVPVTPPTAAQKDTNFSTFAYSTFEASANSTPVNFDTIVFIYDADNDPAAFSGLFM